MPIRTVGLLLSLLRLGLGFCTPMAYFQFALPDSSTQRVCVTFGFLDSHGLSLKIGILQVNHDSYHMFKRQSYESIIARAHMIMRTLVVVRKGCKFLS